jgi:Zn-dependent membrane protease YugP
MLIISLVFMVLGMIASFVLRNKFRKYYHTPLASGITGAQAAQMMLRDHRLYDVAVVCTDGELTDHYNPATRTVNLSEPVYYGYSAASVAIAAHECGHAVQHATAYAPLQFRSIMVPIQNFSAKVMNIFILLSIFGGIAYLGLPIKLVLLVIISAYAVFTLFSFVTLPVEIDASRRALVWMKQTRIANAHESAMAYDALKWAAYTYIIAALGSLAGLMYYVMAFLGMNRD